MNNNFKIFILTILLALLLPLGVSAQQYGIFKEGLIKDIVPKGWLEEFLNRQRTGMTGHPEALAYPYNTCLWAGEIPRIGNYGQDWWRYEQTAYYTDGLIRLGYILDDSALAKIGEDGVKYTIENAQSNGRLGNPVITSQWPMAVFFRAMKAEYEYTGDITIIEALEKHYLSLTANDLAVGRRHIVNIEGILWVYGITHNDKLLKLAEDSYALGGFEMNASQAGSNDYISMHGVTYTEMLKIPMLLYAYTGKEYYLNLALNSESKLERDHMLPDGVPTSAEYTSGSDVDIAHETCDITDYTWSLGYFLSVTGDSKWADRIEKAIFNAGLGSITKDFKSLQYFSSVNQVIATGTSDNNAFKRGSTWMEYRPTHETECCAGNVNRFMPNFASRLWMRGNQGEIVAALYAPSEISFVQEGVSCNIKEETLYPFDGDITFHFSMTESKNLKFKFRIPEWAEGYTLYINNSEENISAVAGTFATIEREFSDGDVVKLNLDMTPHLKSAANNQGTYVECGPLVFSYAVPETKVEDTNIYSNMNGKISGNPDFKCWSITPNAPFNYAINTNEDTLSLEVDTEKLKSGYPFDLENNPLTIKLPVREIAWGLQDGRYNPTLPTATSLVLKDATTTLNLVPYGGTELRLTVFPIQTNVDESFHYIEDENFIIPDEQGWYHLKTVGDVEWFSWMVNQKGHGCMNVKLDNDIDFKGIPDYHQPIGRSQRKYAGHFDGQGHKVKGMVITRSISLVDKDFDGVGFFGSVRGGISDSGGWNMSTNEAIIENLIIDESCSINFSGRFGAGIVGHVNSRVSDSSGVTILNCGNMANITLDGKNAAGIMGCVETTDINICIENCFNTGDISGSAESALICGWTGQRNNSGVKLINCWNTGNLLQGIDGTKNMWRGNTGITTYQLNDFSTNSGTQGKHTPFTSLDYLFTGELCYTLNNLIGDIKWYQTLGKDSAPVPFINSLQVFKHEYPTGEVVYSNNDELSEIREINNDITAYNQQNYYNLVGQKINSDIYRNSIVIKGFKKILNNRIK